VGGAVISAIFYEPLEAFGVFAIKELEIKGDRMDGIVAIHHIADHGELERMSQRMMISVKIIISRTIHRVCALT
jgi:hypothetical protein